MVPQARGAIDSHGTPPRNAVSLNGQRLLPAPFLREPVYQEGGKTLMKTAAADRDRMIGHSHGAGI